MIKRIALIAGIFVMLLAAPAHAQTGGESGSISAAVDESNGTVNSTATGYKPGETVTFSIASTPTVLGSAVANSSGVANLAAALPGAITGGTHTVSSSGIGLNGGQLNLSTQVFVSQVAAETAARNAGVAGPVATTPGSTLPRTGSDNSGLIRIGVLLVALGGGAVLVTRKRRAHLTA